MTEASAPPRSSFHKHRQHQLYDYLVREMDFAPELAHAFITAHQTHTVPQAVDLLFDNGEGIMNHAFFPSGQRMNCCRICEKGELEHVDSDHRTIQQALNTPLEQIQQLYSGIEAVPIREEPQISCQICCIDYPESDMLNLRGQVHDICISCMELYLRQEINNMRVQRISCPHCMEQLPTSIIRELLDAAMFAKYRKLLRNVEVQQNPSLKWCPNPKCAIVVKAAKGKKKSKCPKCATSICNKCNRQSHKGSCQGAFRKQIKEWENASDIQKCKKCGGLVEKIAGCNHMTCMVCHYEWCWLCGSTYSSAHFSGLNPFGCPGLMDGQRNAWGKSRIILLRVGFPLVLPIAMIAGGPVVVANLMWNRYYPEDACFKALIVLASIPLGIIFNPLLWIFSVFYFIPRGIQKLFVWYRDRRIRDRRQTNFLQQRLLAEDYYDESNEEIGQ